MSCGFINLDVAGANLDPLVVPYEHDVGAYVLRREGGVQMPVVK